ncbi:MAG TPA: hypothetical protein EYN66_02325 [Myxococcales bacterium]|nr:hypothetical protein [Myxococcales bacterium]
MHRVITEHFADGRDDLVHSRDVTWLEVRAHRDAALAASDWRAVKDRVLPNAWKEFRDLLRTLPQRFDDPNDAADNWPVMPDE